MAEVRLTSMDEAGFQQFRESNIKEISDENVNAGIWDSRDAVDRARQAFEGLLPDGLMTKDHHFFVIVDKLSGQAVGHLWFKVEEGASGPVGLLFDLCLEKKHRGRGFGTAALKELDKEAGKRGLRAMRLYVLSNKAVAVHLYETNGFWPRTYEMVKEYPAKQ